MNALYAPAGGVLDPALPGLELPAAVRRDGPPHYAAMSSPIATPRR